MTEPVRLTEPGLHVLRLMMTDPRREFGDAEIVERTGQPSGLILMMLERFEAGGWLAGRWENRFQRCGPQRKKRLYRLTALGMIRGKAALEKVQML